MDAAARELLDMLEQRSWFARVGEPADLESVMRVASWSAANQESETEAWEDALIQAGNKQHAAIASVLGSWSFQKSWNEAIPEVRDAARELVNTKVADLEVVLTKSAVDGLRWIVLSNAMGAAFLGRAENDRTFWPITKLIMEGFFPCGWRGDYPEGVLVVF